MPDQPEHVTWTIGPEHVTWTIGPSSGDVEIDAMRQLLVVLAPLTPHARTRVLRWAAGRDDVRADS